MSRAISKIGNFWLWQWISQNGVIRCHQENCWGRQWVVTLIIQGSQPLWSGLQESYFGLHLGYQVSSVVVTSVILWDLPHHHLGSLVVIVTTLLSLLSPNRPLP
jgi:hypothetical protein